MASVETDEGDRTTCLHCSGFLSAARAAERLWG